MTRSLALLALFACDAESVAPSTQVGNPGRVSAVLGGAVQWTSATAEVESWTTTGCGGSPEVLMDGGTLDVLAPQALQLPLGETCGTRMAFDGPLEAIGEVNGQPIRVWLEPRVVQVKLVTPLPTEDMSLWLELGGTDWISVDDVESATPDDNGVVQFGNEGAVRGRLQSRSLLYADLDGDGVLDDSERLESTIEDEDDE